MNDSIYSSIEHRGFTINIHYDTHAESPRTEFENLGTLYTAHRNYQTEEDFDSHFDMDEVCPGKLGEFSDDFLREYIALPVYMYDHSGQTVSTTPFSCHWDSGFFGIIAVSIDKVRKEYRWKSITPKRRKQIETYLKNEIKTYDDYLTGCVYGFTVEDKEGNEVDSCWGFYGEE